MAMGDSMTAGFNGAVKADFKEHRELSFSIGGAKDAVTLPNLIAAVKGNGDLVGPAMGSLSQPKFKATCSGDEIDACRLSAAVDGSDLQDVKDLQVKYLFDTLNNATANAEWAAGVNIREDWKLLTIFSGLDDVVFYNVTDRTKKATSPELFAANLNRLLESVQATFPRTFVNLMLLPEEFDPKITTSRLSCKAFKWYSVITGIHWTNTHDWVATIKGYNAIIAETALAWNSKNLKDFGIGLQPFMQDAPLVMNDMDSLDCFHPNLATHQGMAVALWNNMVATSFENKSRNWKDSRIVTCPSPDSRLLLHEMSEVVV